MKKTDKWKLFLSGAVTLSPILAGLLLWNRLPESLATHWGADGAADGFSGRAFAVFGLPIALLVSQLLVILFVNRTNKDHQDRKILNVVTWILPATSVMASSITLGTALGKEFSAGSILILFFSALFLFIGNYLPKTKRNPTLGVRIKWTLENDENWNATHRFTGKLWFAAGLLLLPSVLLPENAAMTVFSALLFLIILLPLLYSWLYYRKQKANGTWFADPGKRSKRAGKAGTVFVFLILTVAAFLMFSGNIRFTAGEKSFTLDSPYWQSLTVDYDTVESIELQSSVDPGIRTHGFGSARLSMGIFQNDAFGSYTRYSYTGQKDCIVINAGGKFLVISGKNKTETEAIYQQLLQRIAK